MNLASGSDLSEGDQHELTRLETALWQRSTRFDPSFMESVLAGDFIEFGRSGRRYDRQATLDAPDQPLAAELPLSDLQIRLIAEDVVQLTYISRVTYEGVVETGRRSSIWSRTNDGRWILRFHQGTPIPETSS